MPYKEAKKRDLETIELWAKQDLTTQKTKKKFITLKIFFVSLALVEQMLPHDD